MTATKTAAVDWKALEKELVSIVGAEVPSLLEGAAKDLQAYGVEIAASLAKRIAAGDQNVSVELRGQLKMLLEVHQIRANEAAWNAFEQILTVAMRTAKAAIGAALGSVVAGLPGAAAGAIGGGKS